MIELKINIFKKVNLVPLIYLTILTSFFFISFFKLTLSCLLFIIPLIFIFFSVLIKVFGREYEFHEDIIIIKSFLRRSRARKFRYEQIIRYDLTFSVCYHLTLYIQGENENTLRKFKFSFYSHTNAYQAFKFLDSKLDPELYHDKSRFQINKQELNEKIMNEHFGEERIDLVIFIFIVMAIFLISHYIKTHFLASLYVN